MSQQKHVIIGVHISDRIQHVEPVQHVLTKAGCNIRTRLGLHDADENFCSPNGLLLLEMIGTDEIHDDMIGKLNLIEGVEAQKMVFDHL